jgi:serine beta-lactamase-like protein LACTB
MGRAENSKANRFGSFWRLCWSLRRARAAEYAALESVHPARNGRQAAPGARHRALVDDQRIVWRRDFGATPKTVYRVGSVSKLFTDIAIMQRVERGELTWTLPSPRTSRISTRKISTRAITLRQLMSHPPG